MQTYGSSPVLNESWGRTSALGLLAAPAAVSIGGHALSQEPLWRSGHMQRRGFDGAVYATHSPDTGVLTSLAAWRNPKLGLRSSERQSGPRDPLQRVLLETSRVPDANLRAKLTRQMLQQLTERGGSYGSRSHRGSWGLTAAVGDKGSSCASRRSSSQRRRPASAPAVRSRGDPSFRDGSGNRLAASSASSSGSVRSSSSSASHRPGRGSRDKRAV
eukprot:TRINITY_DN86118_c0_g1_i1.p1 TRINITY_DN86118_c0_g1~~TRINITY_DN86118_c0_g1_i1.p1  ORF type:complete len:216 (-),score=27.82 TRINITY_DN86118_c0_g1_i1:161-808(-)